MGTFPHFSYRSLWLTRQIFGVFLVFFLFVFIIKYLELFKVIYFLGKMNFEMYLFLHNTKDVWCVLWKRLKLRKNKLSFHIITIDFNLIVKLVDLELATCWRQDFRGRKSWNLNFPLWPPPIELRIILGDLDNNFKQHFHLAS